MVSRALDDVEESTNRNKASVPREHLVLYQFSARGHEVAQVILGSLLTHPRDGASAYYRSRPLLLSLGWLAMLAPWMVGRGTYTFWYQSSRTK